VEVNHQFGGIMGAIHKLNTVRRRARKVLLGVAILGLGIVMGLPSAVADPGKGKGNAYAHKSQGFGHMTPYSRVAKLPVVKDKGKIDYEATYAKARAASIALATYVKEKVEADELGLDVIQGYDWILGGLEEDSAEGISEAVLRIPSSKLINPNLPASPANTKKANVMDLCNRKWASMALGVAPIVDDKKVVNGYIHSPTLPCEVAIWNDDKHIYVDMLDPNAIFTLFFTDVLFSEDMEDPAFADAIYAMPEQVKSEIMAIIYAALSEFDPEMSEMDQKIGPDYHSIEDIVEVVADSPYESPFLHMAYTKVGGAAFTSGESLVVAEGIIAAMSTHADNPGVHPTPITDDYQGNHVNGLLDDVLSEKSSWRSARLSPITIPGKNHIIEACSPKYAKMALGTGLHHATALPCEITVQIVDLDANGTKESLVISYLDPGFMLNALFADVTDAEKEGFADIPGTIMEDLQNVVTAALEFQNSGMDLNPNERIFYNMLP